MNTGFNAGNIPASPTILESVASTYRDVEALEIMQQRFLATVRISATWEQVQDADYIRVGTANAGGMYYFVNSVNMLATDVAELSISLDALTSVGGVSNIKVIDGETERWSGVDVGDSDDPLLTPCDTMEIEGGWMFEGDSNTTQEAFYECTLSIGSTVQGEGKTYTDGTTGEQVTVPSAKKLVQKTAFRLPNQSSGGTERGTLLYCDSHTGSSSRPNQADENVAGLRSLGLEDAVVAHVVYPSDKVELPAAYAYDSWDDYFAAYITGANVVDTTNVPIDGVIAPNTVKNHAHINKSDFCKMGLLTCSGDSMEFIPKEIDISDGVRMVSDPNTDGRVYYRFKNYKGNSTLDGFWLNSVAGMSWKQTPLVFDGKSGSAIDVARQGMANSLREINYKAGRVDKAAGLLGSVMPSISGNVTHSSYGSFNDVMQFEKMFPTLSASFTEGTGFGANSSFGSNIATGNILSGLTSYFTDLARRDADSLAELTNFGYSQIALPTLKFPYKAETMRDLHNNGVYVYQYKYSQRDITRINKLLTRYGKKYIAALTEDMLVPSNTENFVYVRANGVSVTHKTINNIGENWINNAIASQLEGGVRIWRVSPLNGTV